ncbi:MAG: hypothetical protein EOR18_08955 [Mesorhizobium sp.]|nr:hypothetical protein [Mesorhizobium sp.]RWI75760.1 MAG: hypothetical protein EOR18_08955 [Mesorhizobium sp.]
MPIACLIRSIASSIRPTTSSGDALPARTFEGTGIEGDRLIVPRNGLLDLSGFGMDAGSGIMRVGIVRSELESLVGVFGGVLQP